MQTKFKRHQSVVLRRDPDVEYIEYYSDEVRVTKGMKGKVNIILPNGQYHVEVFDSKGETVAYVKVDEDSIEAEE